jgi:DNA-damage-inducible protein J
MLFLKGASNMPQSMVNFRMDEELKKGMEQVCREMGMSMTTAFTVFAAKVSKERRIPFEVAADPDPFYGNANMERLRKAVADVKSGKAKLTEHELVGAADD